MATLGEYIRDTRERKGITLNAFAKHLEVSSGNVSEWETKGKVPRPEVLKKIAEYFEIDFNILLDLKKGKESKAKENKKDLQTEIIVDRAKITVLERYIAKLVADSLKIEVAQVLKMLDDDTQIEVAERLKMKT